MTGTIFGFTEVQISEFGMTFCVGALIIFMFIIIGNLAKNSKAGKFGTIALFLGLGLGIVGYLAKFVIQYKLGLSL